VAREIGTDTAASAFGTALNTLRTRRGNADGKARLLAALARSVGIPARVATGLAILPGGVFSHSWTELWLGRWTAADPSFGQLPASASLVRIAFGEGSRPVDLLPLVASARFLPVRPVR
jgi:transglutaminase-like putative cysteine protease